MTWHIMTFPQHIRNIFWSIQKSTAPQPLLRCQPIAYGANSKTRESRVEITRIGRTGMALSWRLAAPGAFWADWSTKHGGYNGIYTSIYISIKPSTLWSLLGDLWDILRYNDIQWGCIYRVMQYNVASSSQWWTPQNRGLLSVLVLYHQQPQP